MISVKKGKIALNVCTCKKVPDIAICMSIPYKGHPTCLKMLQHNMPVVELCPSVCDTKEVNASLKNEVLFGAEEASLAYAVFELLREKMIGSPLESSKSKVSYMRCKFLNGYFNIYWNCQGTVSSLRKTLSLALKFLVPQKVFSKYVENMKLLGASSSQADRQHFNYMVKEFINGLNKEIAFSVVGKINVNKGQLETVLDGVSKKLAIDSVPSAKETVKPPKRDCNFKMYPSVKATGVSAVIIADYIDCLSNGMGVEVHDGVVEVYNDSWETKRKSLADKGRVSGFITQKYEKVGEDHLGSLLSYHAMIRCYADADTCNKLAKGVKPKDAQAIILKHL